MALIYKIEPPSEKAAILAGKKWDSIAKPIRSLGLLEDAITKIAALKGCSEVSLDRRTVVVMCADNGVVARNVTQTGSEVTRIVAANIASGKGTVSIMARKAGADVLTVDIGMQGDTVIPGIVDKKIASGTADITAGPAMTVEQAQQAISAGISIVGQLKEKKTDIIATGEMGIGNTTTSSALVSVLLSEPVEKVTGRGAGLSDEGLERKTEAIKKAIIINRPDRADPLGALSAVGGFDIAGMAGLFIGGAIYRIPVIIDGFISAAAALVASCIVPECRCAMLASHLSKEPASKMVLDALQLKPLICAEMSLGEGTGAVCALPLLDMAAAVYNGMQTFDDMGVEAYKPL